VKVVLALIRGELIDPDGNARLSFKPPPDRVQLVALFSE
jgi:hypothetical protein